MAERKRSGGARTGSQKIPGIALDLANLPENVREQLLSSRPRPTDRDILFFCRGWQGRGRTIVAEPDAGPPASAVRVPAPPGPLPGISVVAAPPKRTDDLPNVADAGHQVDDSGPLPEGDVPPPIDDAPLAVRDGDGYPYVEDVRLEPSHQRACFNFAKANVEAASLPQAYRVVQGFITSWSDGGCDVKPSSWESQLTARFEQMEILQAPRGRRLTVGAQGSD